MGKTQEKKTKEKNQKILHGLYERIKELNCFYALSKLVEGPDTSLEKILRGVASILPPSWQYPKIASARVVFEGKTYQVSNFKEVRWKLSADIIVFGKRAGMVEVCYLKECPVRYEGPFLKEERVLLDAITKQLSKIIERKKMEKEIRESKKRLIKQKSSLEQKNIALGEIIGQVEVEKNNIRENILASVDKLILPALEKLRIKKENRKHVDLIKHHLRGLTAPFAKVVAKSWFRLTPREIEICSMIKSGLASKEIAGLLGVSLQTIEKHRKNIRKKLKLANRKINLTSFVQQF
ncbi:helix-turn-helix transcriptional regulator [Candidatus Margulisiibacteriota bacterium]